MEQNQVTPGPLSHKAEGALCKGEEEERVDGDRSQKPYQKEASGKWASGSGRRLLAWSQLLLKLLGFI